MGLLSSDSKRVTALETIRALETEATRVTNALTGGVDSIKARLTAFEATLADPAFDSTDLGEIAARKNALLTEKMGVLDAQKAELAALITE